MKKLIALLLVLALVGCARPVMESPQNTTEEFVNGGYHEVIIKDFVYAPKSLTIYQGDRVKWINQMPFVKSVWVWGEEPSPVIQTNKSWSFIFSETGFFKIRDQFSQDMEMNITVLPYEERPDINAQSEAQ